MDGWLGAIIPENHHVGRGLWEGGDEAGDPEQGHERQEEVWASAAAGPGGGKAETMIDTAAVSIVLDRHTDRMQAQQTVRCWDIGDICFMPGGENQKEAHTQDLNVDLNWTQLDFRSCIISTTSIISTYYGFEAGISHYVHATSMAGRPVLHTVWATDRVKRLLRTLASIAAWRQRARPGDTHSEFQGSGVAQAFNVWNDL